MERTKLVSVSEVKPKSPTKSLLAASEGNRIDYLRNKLAISDRYGIDTISIPGSAYFGIESVLSSAVLYGDGVVLIGKSRRTQTIKKILGTYKIPFYEVYAETNSSIVDEVVSVLHTSRRYKHVVVSVSTLNNEFYEMVELLSDLHETNGMQMIVDFNGSLTDIHPMPMFCDIDCLVLAIAEFGSGVHYQNLVFAHRRFLTLCEGRSQTVSLDLYSAWQMQFETAAL